MTPDEVRMLDNRYALLFVRGEKPVRDLKFDILSHPNVYLTEDGKSRAFEHGTADKALFTISLTGDAFEALQESEAEDAPETGYVLLSEEDVEDEMRKEEIGDGKFEKDTGK